MPSTPCAGRRLVAYLGAGPKLGRATHVVVGLATTAAFASLAVQVRALIGERGLLPATDAARVAAAIGSWLDAPTLFRWVSPTDDWLVAGCAVGAGLGVAAAVGLWPRIALLCAAPLYLSYVWMAADLMAFQWDAMLVEVCVLGAAFPSRPTTPWRTAVPLLTLRSLLLKLYGMSGLAKLASPLGDWIDGSAMRFYYETAPLPGPFAWYAHHLPAAWHAFESYLTLVIELPLAAFVLGPRKLRIVAATALSALQVVNLATANYGFFVWLSLGLHVVLLDDADLEAFAARVGAWTRRWPRAVREVMSGLVRGATAPATAPVQPSLPVARLRATCATALVTAYAVGWALASAAVAFTYFVRKGPEPVRVVARLGRATHLANGYHLFASVTRDRVEPQVEVTVDRVRWIELDLPAKPGDPHRRPPLVAPHLPRLDFRLWFYGLFRDAGAPAYAVALLDRLCDDPDGVRRLFAKPPPRNVRAARFAFYRYRFAPPDLRTRTGAWWWRERIGSTVSRVCGKP
jgi:hypothetical protein